jgi:SAM-dependent methyltransferase
MKSIINNQADVFNDVASDYRSLHSDAVKISGETSEYFAEYKIIELKKYFDRTSAIKILDIGCGDGISAGFFQKHLDVIQYDGYDISEESVKIARERNLHNTSFYYYEGFELNAAADKYDLVFISCVMHHVDHSNHLNLLQQAYKALKEGGKLVIFEHNPYNPITRKIVRDCVFDKDAVLIKPSVMKKVASDAGFPDVRCFFTLFFPRKKFFNFLLAVEKYLSAVPVGGQYYILATK